ncbi:hypothetical protein AG4045_024761 [Apium graveolens]|uniref:Uncharacterized protein n=1 Tax=Apium graveolens TaxID=4045 RepID=A0A6L5BAR4_APIGR|nr:hypothetical protein AG4045_024761 [Apium graveolens]
MQDGMFILIANDEKIAESYKQTKWKPKFDVEKEKQKAEEEASCKKDAVEKAEKQLNLTIGVFVSIVVVIFSVLLIVLFGRKYKPVSPSQNLSSKKTDAAEPSNIQESNEKKKEDMAIEVVGGGNFCIQLVAYQKEASIIQQKLASLKLQEAPTLGSFNPEKSDLLLAQFREDNSRYRAMEG